MQFYVVYFLSYCGPNNDFISLVSCFFFQFGGQPFELFLNPKAEKQMHMITRAMKTLIPHGVPLANRPISQFTKNFEWFYHARLYASK